MFLENFQQIQRIAKGGAAEVFRAVQTGPMGFQRVVAIKRMLPQHIGSVHYERMLVQEAKLLVTLKHPNIVQVYDLGCQDGAFFFVMDYVDGLDLRKIIQWHQNQNRSFPIENTIIIASEICKALEYAHNNKSSDGKFLGLVHMDISPKNILISRAGEVKLSDFGIAHFKAPKSMEGTKFSLEDHRVVRGKYSYMSPEQAMGISVEAPSDIFSLGLVLYELLMGERLYQSQNLLDLQKEHLNYPAKAPLFSFDIPSELEYIILRCLAYEPDDRYQSAAELYHDFIRFLYYGLGTLPNQQLAFMMEEIMPKNQALPSSSKISPLEESTLTDLKGVVVNA